MEPTRAERIRATLTAALDPVAIDVVDESARHAGHAGAAPGGETHYAILVVADAFRGEGRVARSRRIHALLAAEFRGGLHALSLVLRAPDEHFETIRS